MMVFTLAKGSNTSLDLRGELAAPEGVLDTDLRALLTGVEGALSVMIAMLCCVGIV